MSCRRVGQAERLCEVAAHLGQGEPYHWAPPVQTHEKIRKLEILAGAPKQRSGEDQGRALKGG